MLLTPSSFRSESPSRASIEREENEYEFDWVLVQSTTDFSDKFKELPNGFPILLDFHSGLVCEPVLLWLHESYFRKQERKKWFNTCWGYANDAKDWFIFLEKIERPWNLATLGDLDSYSETMRKVKSPITGRKYATSTINRRRASIAQFYAWCRSQHQFGLVASGEKDLLNPNVKPNANYRKQRDEKEHVSVLLIHQTRALLKELGPKPSEIVDLFLTTNKGVRSFTLSVVAQTSRDRLAADIALHTGLRVFEIAGLTLKHFRRFQGHEISDTVEYAVGPIWRKGGRNRNVWFFGVTIKEILQYIEGERMYLVNRFGAQSDSLLLNPMGAGKYSGKATSKRTIERHFHDACLRAGLRKSLFLPSSVKTGELHAYEAPLFVFHDLRHTYTVYTYYSRRNTDENPFMYLQKQLDHNKMATTINIYMHVMQEFEQNVTDRYMEDMARAT